MSAQCYVKLTSITSTIITQLRRWHKVNSIVQVHNIWTSQTLHIYLEYEVHSPTNILSGVFRSRALQTLAMETIR